jgi:heptosyltransferase-1/heptosyltransferase-2
MMNNTWLFRASSALTDHFPGAGARFLDALVNASAGNERLHSREMARARATLARAKGFDRILVVADLNIGDAIMLQSFVSALRDFLPAAQIDYAVSGLARDLVNGPDVSTLFPIYRGSGVHADGDIDGVRHLTEARHYDLVFNLCPFFPDHAIAPPGTPVVGWTALGTLLIRALRDPDAPAHVTARTHQLVHTLMEPILPVMRDRPFRGVSVTLSKRAAREAIDLVRAVNPDHRPLVLMNPDASSQFTRLPDAHLAALLRGLLDLPATVVLGAGHTFPGIEARLIGMLPPRERRRVHVLPASTPLDTYTAVVDAADVYLTGDTGPLHIAAARKLPLQGTQGFRNRTRVVSVFGATPARLYGYASGHPGFLPANQDAPSHVHVADSPCRNLTCINKTAKSCGAVRCFQQLDVEAVLADVARGLVPARSGAEANTGAAGRDTVPQNP